MEHMLHSVPLGLKLNILLARALWRARHMASGTDRAAAQSSSTTNGTKQWWLYSNYSRMFDLQALNDMSFIVHVRRILSAVIQATCAYVVLREADSLSSVVLASIAVVKATLLSDQLG